MIIVLRSLLLEAKSVQSQFFKLDGVFKVRYTNRAISNNMAKILILSQCKPNGFFRYFVRSMQKVNLYKVA